MSDQKDGCSGCRLYPSVETARQDYDAVVELDKGMRMHVGVGSWLPTTSWAR